VFWENHDPTQGNRQGNDIGTAYRSAIYWTTDAQEAAARTTRSTFQDVLTGAGRGEITTDLESAGEAGPFYYAEDYHQQYLHKVPNGYCGIGGTGVSCPVGAGIGTGIGTGISAGISTGTEAPAEAR
jgi:peptide-methionine (S)-S-oxide reductase